MYKLFIDDERDPVTDDWIVARSSAEAIAIMTEHGMPNEIAFDHDLGGDDTSIRILGWMVEGLLHDELKIPADFIFSVHSQNPIGAENIRSQMNQIVKHFKLIQAL